MFDALIVAAVAVVQLPVGADAVTAVAHFR